MSNSSLVNYVKISPNRNSPRNHDIDTITIHHVAGNLTVETIGDVFANPKRQGSSNYGIGSDGRIGMYVEEKDRSWASSNRANDNRAITIEVANDGGASTNWHVSNKALASLIKLCADICKRNNIKQLVWSDNKSFRVNHINGCNMTVHKDFAATACPGPYLFSKQQYIADEVNKLLGINNSSSTTSASTSTSKTTYTVKNGDTLSLIGSKTGINWKTIADINGIKPPYVISVGQVLKLTNSSNTSTVKPSTPSTPSSNDKYIFNGVDYSLVFDPKYYSDKYADLKKSFGTNKAKLFDHFLKNGMNEGRQAISTFNVKIYKDKYPDLQRAFGNKYPEYYKHYCLYGYKEKRKGI